MPIYKRRKKPEDIKPYKGPKILVRLDSKTVITVYSQKSYNVWLERYPDAKIISETPSSL